MLVATVTLTNDQIKALPTTPFELVAAPGAGKVLAFFGAVVVFDCTAGVYTNDNGYDARLYIVGYQLVSNSVFIPEINDSSNVRYVQISPVSVPDGNDPPLFNVNTVYNLIAMENAPLQLGCLNFDPAQNFTGGNAANTCSVTTFYAIVDV